MPKIDSWKQSGWRLLWITLVVIALDQITKQWILSELPLFGRIEVLPFFDIIHVRNYGAAFSFLSEQSGWQRWFFTALALIISTILLVLMRRQSASMWRLNLAYALVIGGALGNVLDRLQHGFVVDFLDFYVRDYHWPAFNVADMAIVIGAGVMILDSFLTPDTPSEKPSGAGKSSK